MSSCFLVFRLYVKLRSFRRLYSDDYLVLAAWIMLLAFAILWQIEASTLYLQYAVQSGVAPFTPGFINRDIELLRSIVPFTILFYSCLWAVKISLLLFFRRLQSNVRGQRIGWWSIFALPCLLGPLVSEIYLGDVLWALTTGSMLPVSLPIIYSLSLMSLIPPSPLQKCRIGAFSVPYSRC